ncbi:MAG TPA: carbohydrate binding domain-containing protein [Pyrinomonadaceae bacterium]|nr:carbohydrate binding domain-containing protein [Pyrinomonadaceae bacterium]
MNKLLLALGILAIVVGSVFAAKWNLANAISTRAGTKDLADIAASLAPDDPQTRYAAAVVYDRTFDTADAERSLVEFQATVDSTPNNYIPWLSLAQAKIRSGDNEGAVQAAARALQLAPNYAAVHWLYGNLLFRNGSEKAMPHIRIAAEKDPKYRVPAISLAMNDSQGDIAKVRSLFGNSSDISAAIAQHYGLEKKFAESRSAWLEIAAEERRTSFVEQAKILASAAITGKQYRYASMLLEDAGQSFGKPGVVSDGGFESGVKARGAQVFEWQIADGAEPQIAISSSTKKSGANSLLLQFNTMEASGFRSVSQIVAVEPGNSYAFSAYYRSELKTAATIKFVITDATTGTVLASTASIAANSDWANISANFTVPSGIDGVTIAIARADCNASICPISGRVWLDDITLTK